MDFAKQKTEGERESFPFLSVAVSNAMLLGQSRTPVPTRIIHSREGKPLPYGNFGRETLKIMIAFSGRRGQYSVV